MRSSIRNTTNGEQAVNVYLTGATAASRNIKLLQKVINSFNKPSLKSVSLKKTVLTC